MALLHTAHISFYEGTPEETRQHIFQMYQTLAEDCGGADAGILFWRTGWNRDLREKLGKVWHIAETAIFLDDDALQAFRVHPAHVALTTILRECADWTVGDIKITLPLNI